VKSCRCDGAKECCAEERKSTLEAQIKSTEPKCSPEELEKFWTEADDTIHNRGYGLNVRRAGLAALQKLIISADTGTSCCRSNCGTQALIIIDYQSAEDTSSAQIEKVD
jgi:hypothetical protein